nr:hypothetical protein [Tanacetum cinerariifolium]
MHIEKNMLEAILNTLLMNDKSKDTAKERQDLQRLDIRSGLWLGQTKNRKCLKPQATYSFTLQNRKKFCQFIKGVKLPYAFGSCFKHKVTDNDTNITGLKSHECHIMMQRLLPYGLQQYLPDKIANLIIELCSLFKQIYSATLMEDDMLKAQIKVVDILCDLELIYPHALFDIMIHLVIHLPLEALEGGPICSQWMFPFKRYMKKLKVDGVRYAVHSRDECHTTQNSGICSPGPDEEMYYGQLQEILEFKYLLFKVVLFRVRAKPHLKVVEHVNHKKFSNGGVIVVEDDPDIIHFKNSSDLPLSTSLNDLDNATLHIDGQSMEVDARPDIIDVPDKYDDLIEDEDALPHDLADSDDEDLINVDDDGVDKILHGPTAVTVAVRIVPLHTMYPPVAGVASLTEAKANKSLIWAAGQRVHNRQTLMPLGDHAAHWSSYIWEVIRGVPLYYPSWLNVSKERKAALITYIEFDLRPHIESPDWTEIDADIQQHLQKAYNSNNASFKAHHWVIDPKTGTYNVEKIRRARPVGITAKEQSSATQEYPSLIDTFFVAHTVNAVFTRDEDRLIYEEMRRREATGTYTDDEINFLARRGKQRGHIPNVGRVLPARVTTGPSRPAPESTLKSLHKKVEFMMMLFKSDSNYSDAFSQFESAGASGSGGYGDDEESADDQEDEDEDGDGDS